LKRGLAAEGVVVSGRLPSRDFGVLGPAEKNGKRSRRGGREAE
jgi:hypothetical protein